MALDSFKPLDVTTRRGPVRLWLTQSQDVGRRPLVFAMPGVLANSEDMERLVSALGLLGDGCVMRPPKDFGPGFDLGGLADLASVVGEILETTFADRRIVLLGASSSGAVALGVRARNLARIVAVDPPLVTGQLWPVLDQLGHHLGQVRNDLQAQAFVGAAFGVTLDGIQPRDHTPLLQGLAVPADVILAGEPLMPQRQVTRFPSLVGEAERRRLSETPGVRLHVIPGTGHNVLGAALHKVVQILSEACRRAGRDLPPERLALDEPLLEATPLTLRRLLYRGGQGGAFARAYGRLNPQAEVVLEAPHGEPVEAVVLGGPVPAEDLARLAGALAPGGHLIARWRAPDAALRDALAAAGLVLREPTDAAGTGVVRAQKLAEGQALRPALFLHSIAYASLLMDIRTRLPTTGLAADPDLRVVYDIPPFGLAALPREAPKVLLVQRPMESKLESWRPFLAQALRDGWVVAMEYDDYPPLIAEVKGNPPNPQAMTAFGYMHGVQTASPPLVELFRPFNPEVALFPNAVFDLAPFPQGPRPRRVFYGAVIRGRYAVEVARSLGPALDGLDDVEVVAIGDREVFDALPTANKRYFDYMGYEAYLDLMADCTVSLSPIEALPFRDTKSDAKFLDASRAGVLTVASPTIYDRVIRHGENGLLARDVGDWAPLLRQALTDEAARERMARAAWEEVRSQRMFAHQAARRRDWYWSLWERRAELNEALMSRVPGLREAHAALIAQG